MSRTQIQSVRWWHESIIELMILHPDWKQAQMARELNVSQAWLSTIIHSDAFQILYRDRREAHFAHTSKTVVQKAEALAHVTLDALTEKIERLPEAVSPKELRETSEMCMKALGFSARAGDPAPGQVTNNTLIVASSDALAKSRELMQGAQLALEQRKGASVVVDAEPNGSLLPAPEKVQAGGSG